MSPGDGGARAVRRAARAAARRGADRARIGVRDGRRGRRGHASTWRESAPSDDLERAVVVAVPVVRVVQVTVDEIVDVVAMRDRLVPAVGAVGV